MIDLVRISRCLEQALASSDKIGPLVRASQNGDVKDTNLRVALMDLQVAQQFIDTALTMVKKEMV